MAPLFILLGIFAIIGVCIWMIYELCRPHPTFIHERNLEAALEPEGKLMCNATFRYREGDGFIPAAQKALNDWALQLEPENQKRSPELKKALQTYFTYRFPNNEPLVVDIKFTFPPPPEAGPPARAKRLHDNLTDTINSVEVLIERLNWLVKEKPEVAEQILKGHTVKQYMDNLKREHVYDFEETARRELNKIVHYPGDLKK